MAEDEKVKKAVEKIADADRLLDGEDPDTDDLYDAKHWFGVYGELLGFKQSLVAEAESASAGLSPAARPEAATDLTVLRGERDRLHRRRDFWRQKVEQLG